MAELDFRVVDTRPSAVRTGLRASERRLLIDILAVSVVLRVISALIQGDSIVLMPGVWDQVSYDSLARQLLAGHGFSFPQDWWPTTRAGAPTAHWSFLYTLYLSGVYAAFGWHPLVARVIQAVIGGICLPVLTWSIGRRLFGPTVALVAAALSAVYAYFVFYAGALMTEAFYMLAVLWALDLAMVLGERRSAHMKWAEVRLWLLLGLAMGIAGLLRQLLLLFFPVLALWLIWRAGSRRWTAVKDLAVSALVVLVLITPWTIRNYAAFGRLVPLNTNAGYAFFWGNNPIYGTQFVPILPSDVYEQLIPTELRGLDEAALDSALMSRGIGFVVDDPGRYVMLSLSRVPAYFEFWPTADSSLASNVMRVLSFGVCLPFMLFGVAAAMRLPVERQKRADLALVCVFVVFYTLLHLLTWTLIRYRLPVDAALMPFAALGAVRLVCWLRPQPFEALTLQGDRH